MSTLRAEGVVDEVDRFEDGFSGAEALQDRVRLLDLLKDTGVTDVAKRAISYTSADSLRNKRQTFLYPTPNLNRMNGTAYVR